MKADNNELKDDKIRVVKLMVLAGLASSYGKGRRLEDTKKTGFLENKNLL